MALEVAKVCDRSVYYAVIISSCLVDSVFKALLFPMSVSIIPSTSPGVASGVLSINNTLHKNRIEHRCSVHIEITTLLNKSCYSVSNLLLSLF